MVDPRTLRNESEKNGSDAKGTCAKECARIKEGTSQGLSTTAKALAIISITVAVAAGSKGCAGTVGDDMDNDADTTEDVQDGDGVDVSEETGDVDEDAADTGEDVDMETSDGDLDVEVADGDLDALPEVETDVDEEATEAGDVPEEVEAEPDSSEDAGTDVEEDGVDGGADAVEDSIDTADVSPDVEPDTEADVEEAMDGSTDFKPDAETVGDEGTIDVEFADGRFPVCPGVYNTSASDQDLPRGTAVEVGGYNFIYTFTMGMDGAIVRVSCAATGLFISDLRLIPDVTREIEVPGDMKRITISLDTRDLTNARADIVVDTLTY